MIQVFPVGDRSSYERRFNASHQGIDIFSSESAPIVAVEKGAARTSTEKLGGLAVYLRADSGWKYYYAHLSEYEGSFPRNVRAGDVLGYMGNTGNASGGPDHLHFQIATPDGETVDPYDYLKSVQSSSRPGKGGMSKWLLGLLAVGGGVALYRMRRRA